MSLNVKRLTLFIFGVSALILVSGGNWYQGLLIWMAALLALVWVEMKHIQQRLPNILPKLYVCAKPDEFLQWMQDLKSELVFKNFFQEKLDVYNVSGFLYEVGRPNLSSLKVNETLVETQWMSGHNPLQAEKKLRDPLKILEKHLLTPADCQRRLLNDLYQIWIQGGEGFKVLKPAVVKQLIHDGEAKILDADTQKTILNLIGKLIIAKWFLGHQQRQEAEQLLTELRETEVFNLMFGEVNFHLGQIEIQKKQKTKATYFFKVALNFADDTALESLIIDYSGRIQNVKE
jgi:hypothetical protein